MAGTMTSEEEGNKQQEVVRIESIEKSQSNIHLFKVAEPTISGEDKELQSMATKVEDGVRQDMVSGEYNM